MGFPSFEGERAKLFSMRPARQPIHIYGELSGILGQLPAGGDARVPARILARDHDRELERVVEVERR
jgi:hypothetical protein